MIGFLLDGTYQWPILSYRVSFLLAVSDNILCAAYGSLSSHIALYHGAGGITACVVAGRLAARDPSLRILILEGGQHALEEAAHVQP